ncbi:uncharacterized protein [Physeter macrocephalus]|uniref:Uncharacterized protein isoform X2 n=1 Tax=Physeter macrocephalus TaxID=9755 RepID=A0A455B199_PHYMC|nr:uncharacterized protein LOC114485399 isoform X2 [Physeter catodon]|eukprot:XP_028342547.1 uncharacterized protein LOC114485399 isoform X2 [Physeter catodon]
MLSPPPSSVGKGGAGGYAPSPNATSVSGGVTPRITSSPRTKTRGTLEPPWKVPGSRFFTAAASSLPRTTSRGRPVATPRRAEADYAHAAASSPASLANGGATNGTTCPSLAVTSRTGLGRLGRLCWKGRRGEGAAPLPTSLFPWSRRTTAQPIGSEMWRVASSLWVYAAFFCLVTNALEMRLMTSSHPPTNRKRSRGELGPPPFSRCPPPAERAKLPGVLQETAEETAFVPARRGGLSPGGPRATAPDPPPYFPGYAGLEGKGNRGHPDFPRLRAAPVPRGQDAAKRDSPQQAPWGGECRVTGAGPRGSSAWEKDSKALPVV